MKLRLCLLALCLLLTLLAACSDAPEPSSTPAFDAGGVAAALIDAASQLIQQEDYTAARAVLDQLEESTLGPEALQALALLRGTLDTRLAAPPETSDVPVSVTTTPPVQTLAPELSTETEADLLAHRQQDVNVFLTIFADSPLQEFQNGTVGWDNLLSFSLDYLARQQPDALTQQEGLASVEAEQVESVLLRFFGLEARHSSGEDYTYREGRYQFALPEARSATVAIASSAVALGGGQYSVTFDRYTGETGEDLSAYYGFSSQQISETPLHYQDSGEAVLQAVTLEGRSTFQLVEYRLGN